MLFAGGGGGAGTNGSDGGDGGGLQVAGENGQGSAVQEVVELPFNKEHYLPMKGLNQENQELF